MPPDPKPRAQRRRRNRDVTGKSLEGGERASRPELPDADSVCEATRAWWETVWASPMAAVWLEADVPALVRLAMLHNLVQGGDTRGPVLAEMRQLEDRFGLSPLARRRLAWELEQATGERPDEGGSSPSADDGRWLRAVSD